MAAQPVSGSHIELGARRDFRLLLDEQQPAPALESDFPGALEEVAGVSSSTWLK